MSASVLIEARQDVPNALVNLVVQIVDGLDFTICFLLELKLPLRQGQLLRRRLFLVICLFALGRPSLLLARLILPHTTVPLQLVLDVLFVILACPIRPVVIVKLILQWGGFIHLLS